MASGFLTGKYKRNQAAPDGTRLAGNPERANSYFTVANFDKVESLEKIATNAGHTMTELAISWLLSKDVVSSVISGATKTEQVEINVKAAEWELDTSIIEEIEIILND